MGQAEETPGAGGQATIEKPHETPEGFQPNVLAFACNYCAFAAADLAGIMRLKYSPSVKIIRMPCTGKIDHIYVLRAFEKGADGVFVAGCLPGQCHFLEGNTVAAKRVRHIKRLLESLGIDPARHEMYNLSAAQGPRWAEICSEFVERIRKLGPSPVRIALEKRGGAGRSGIQ
jgi:coenzyme F420-reducing hydrogenase delta subunit